MKIMNITEEICNIIDRYIPAEGPGTEREQLRIRLHSDIRMLIDEIKSNTESAKRLHWDLSIKAFELMKQHPDLTCEAFGELPEVKNLWGTMDVIRDYYLS